MSTPVERLNAALEGRYAIERELGEGGMATVYLARDERHNRNVALKVLKPELAAAVGAERFLAEIETTANLQHPHILPLFDSGEADSFLFYVMPYVEGESLRERLDREHQLPVDDAVEIAKNVAEALDYAHRQGVIHRDIKPANVLLQDGKPVVSDFGIALAVGVAVGGRLTETGLSLGTPHYMSPEQATGDLSVRAATDIYALGCVLYEMLVGDPPHTGKTAQAILGKIVTGDADPVTEHRSAVPPHVDGAIRRALEKLPADRFTAAHEFARALGDPGFTHGLAPVGAPARGSRWATAAFVAGALVGVVGAAVAMGAFAPAEPEGLVRFTIEPGGDDPRVGLSNLPSLTVSPAGDFIAYTARTPDGLQLTLRSLDQLATTPLAGAEVGVSPFFSPDGQWLGFVHSSRPTELYRISIRGGAPVLVTEAEGQIWGASWGTDDQIVFGSSNVDLTGVGLFRVAAGGGEPERLTDPQNLMQHRWPSTIEGEDAVLFTVALPRLGSSTRWEIAALDLVSREVTPLGLSGTGARYVSTGHLVYAAPDGSVRAVGFDPRSFELSGSPVPLVENVSVSPSGAASFSVSAEGRLTYVGPGPSGLSETRDPATWPRVWVDRDGTEEPLPLPQRAYRNASVSPDGQRLATSVRSGGSTDLWVYDVVSGAGLQLTENGLSARPIWSPDGSRIYFIYFVEGAEAFANLYSVPSDGSGPPVRLSTADVGVGGSLEDVTPDGRTLILTVAADNAGTDIISVAADGSGDPVPLVVGPSNRDSGRISPDGRWIAYRSDESGAFEVYVGSYPGSGARVPVSIGGGTAPQWSADGRELFYRRGDDMLVAAEIGGDATPEVIRRTELFSAGAYEWPGRQGLAQDGRFLMRRRPGSPGTIDPGYRINVVLNWFEELRERVLVD